jgi:hypothetical protein
VVLVIMVVKVVGEEVQVTVVAATGVVVGGGQVGVIIVVGVTRRSC